MSGMRTPVSRNATGAVGVPGGGYGGYTVTAATATAAILIRDGAAGTIIDSIPASTAAGTTKALDCALKCTQGVYFDLNGGTGTVVIHLEGG